MKERNSFSKEIGNNVKVGFKGAEAIGSQVSKRTKPLVEDRVRRFINELIWNR